MNQIIFPLIFFSVAFIQKCEAKTVMEHLWEGNVKGAYEKWMGKEEPKRRGIRPQYTAIKTIENKTSKAITLRLKPTDDESFKVMVPSQQSKLVEYKGYDRYPKLDWIEVADMKIKVDAKNKPRINETDTIFVTPNNIHFAK